MSFLKKIYYSLRRLWELYFNPKAVGRHLKYFYQRVTRGFSDKECWDLDRTIAKYIIPRLKVLKNLDSSHPIEFNSAREWNKAIDKMIWSFEFVLTDYGSSEYDFKNTQKWKFKQSLKMKRYKEGMKLFVKHYNSLWN